MTNPPRNRQLTPSEPTAERTIEPVFDATDLNSCSGKIAYEDSSSIWVRIYGKPDIGAAANMSCSLSHANTECAKPREQVHDSNRGWKILIRRPTRAKECVVRPACARVSGSTSKDGSTDFLPSHLA